MPDVSDLERITRTYACAEKALLFIQALKSAAGSTVLRHLLAEVDAELQKVEEHDARHDA